MTTTVCSPIPTLTRTDIIQTYTEFLTYSESVSTLAGDVSTSYFSTDICSPSDVHDFAALPCTPTISTIFITLPGPTTLVQVPVTVVADGVATQTTTLFGSTCSVITGPYTPPVSPSPSIESPRVTPGPSKPILASNRLTSPITSAIAASQSPGVAQKSFPVAAIAGGAAGALALVVAIALAGWHYFRKPSSGKKFHGKQYKYDTIKFSDYNSYTGNDNGAYNYFDQSCQPHQSYQPPQDPCCEPQNTTSCQQNSSGGTGTGGTGTGAEQGQNPYDQYHLDRLKKPLENLIKKKIEEYGNKPQRPQSNHRVLRPGQRPNQNQPGHGHTSAPSRPPRYSHSSQPSNSSSLELGQYSHPVAQRYSGPRYSGYEPTGTAGGQPYNWRPPGQ